VNTVASIAPEFRFPQQFSLINSRRINPGNRWRYNFPGRPILAEGKTPIKPHGLSLHSSLNDSSFHWLTTDLLRRKNMSFSIRKKTTFCVPLLVAMFAPLIAGNLALASDPALEKEARAAIRMWLEVGLKSGKPEQLDAILAPEFQIQRADGNGFNKADYMKGGLPQIREIREITDVAATQHENIMVVRYRLTIQENVAGKPVEPTGPRLTVFRREGSRWLVVAHSNFAKIAQ
jgi:hypothetical protein